MIKNQISKNSKFFLLFEIIISIITFLIIISGFFLPTMPIGMLWNIPLLIFIFINIIAKFICLFCNLSVKKRAILHIPILIYLLILLFIGFFSGTTIIFYILFFTLIFTLNLEYNYFVKFIPEKRK